MWPDDMAFQHLPICLLASGGSAAGLPALCAAMEAGGMAGPVALFQDAAGEPRALEAGRGTFRRLVPRGVVFAADSALGPAATCERALAWAFETLRAPAALVLDDELLVPRDWFRVLAALYAAAGAHKRVAMLAAACGAAAPPEQLGPLAEARGYALLRTAWQACRPLLHAYHQALAGRPYADRPADRIAAWHGRLGWPPLPGDHATAWAVACNTLGLARIGCGEAPPDAFDAATLDAIVAAERTRLLQLRLDASAFMGCTGLIETMRLLRQIDGAMLLRPVAGGALTELGGCYPDRWCHPETSFSFAADCSLREIALQAVAAQHLPRGASLAVSLNGQVAGTVWLDPGEAFSLSVQVPPRLDGLERRLHTRCSVDIAPCDVGFNADRRRLAFLLVSLTLVAADGERTVLAGEEILTA